MTRMFRTAPHVAAPGAKSAVSDCMCCIVECGRLCWENCDEWLTVGTGVSSRQPSVGGQTWRGAQTAGGLADDTSWKRPQPVVDAGEVVQWTQAEVVADGGGGHRRQWKSDVVRLSHFFVVDEYDPANRPPDGATRPYRSAALAGNCRRGWHPVACWGASDAGGRRVSGPATDRRRLVRRPAPRRWTASGCYVDVAARSYRAVGRLAARSAGRRRRIGEMGVGDHRNIAAIRRRLCDVSGGCSAVWPAWDGGRVQSHRLQQRTTNANVKMTLSHSTLHRIVPLIVIQDLFTDHFSGVVQVVKSVRCVFVCVHTRKFDLWRLLTSTLSRLKSMVRP